MEAQKSDEKKKFEFRIKNRKQLLAAIIFFLYSLYGLFYDPNFLNKLYYWITLLYVTSLIVQYIIRNKQYESENPVLYARLRKGGELFFLILILSFFINFLNLAGLISF